MTLVNHNIVGLIVRLTFVLYGVVQDYVSEVPYTDIDYTVFTDAARNVYEGKSPYDRHTYRYSPLIAFLLIPNIIIHPSFGKILFSVSDILISYIIQVLLSLNGINQSRSIWYSMLWLYNPLSIVISTRGNADSLAALLVLWSLLLFKKKKYFWCGIVHGLAIHFRLYPLLFSLPMYMSIKDKHNAVLKRLYPNKSRLILVLSCIFTIILLFTLSYYLYGDQFLQESILYHIKRTDVRHNYSVYFYSQYLGVHHDSKLYLKLFMLVPQLVLLLTVSFFYGTKEDLPFCEFCISFILVCYNSVLTCQYFIWYLCLLPLCAPYIRCTIRTALIVSSIWVSAQVLWLLPAYLLEFKSVNTYFWIWIQGLFFFISNIIVLSTFIKSYSQKSKNV